MSNSRQSPSPLEHLYVDISSFARRQARSYFTYTRDSVVRRVESTSSKRRERRAPSSRTAPVLGRHSQKAASARQKRLTLERKRLANYIYSQPGLGTRQLLEHGQYRSLQRRIFNLQYWESTCLDMRGSARNSQQDFQPIRAFAALDRTVYSALQYRTRELRIEHDPQCARWSNKLFENAESRGWQELFQKWIEFDIGTRKPRAYPLLLYLLDRKPGRALDFIRILAYDPALRTTKDEILADALGHLARLHAQESYDTRGGWSADSKSNKDAFIPVFVHLFRERLSKKPHVCSQDLLYNIAGIAGTEDLKKVFDCLVEYPTRLGFDTLLHYASAFGKAGEFRYALRCLDELKARIAVAWHIVVDRERLRWTCALILRKSMSQGQQYHDTPDIVAAFVRLGIKMDILLYNVVMDNAMEAGDYATAFKVYNALESNELKPDKHTYSILLNGCALQSNPAIFRDFAEYCAELAVETRDPWLATDYLYYSYVCHENDTDTVRLSSLLWQIYLRFFTANPLEPFVSHGRRELRHAIAQQNFDTESKALEPTTVALYIMLQTEIRSAAAISNHRVSDLYEQFKLLATQDNNQAITRLAQEPISWNAFLFAFCQQNQFASASQLIKDMTDGPVAPNVFSWNIFMQAFFKTGQVQAAERVFDIMRRRGIDPDQYSYGVLLRGYARAQLVDRVGATMEHLDMEDDLDPDILRALASVVHRKKLMLALEKSRLDKEAKAAEKANKEAEAERHRWALAHPANVVSQTPFGTTIASALEPEEGQPDSWPQPHNTISVSEKSPLSNPSTVCEESQPRESFVHPPSYHAAAELPNGRMQSAVSKKLPRFSVRRVLARPDPGYSVRRVRGRPEPRFSVRRVLVRRDTQK